jgi:hypothetical protein
MITLDEAKTELKKRLDKGATCPCCGQFAKIYNRKLNSAMAYSLILVAKYFEANPWEEWLHVERYLSRKTRATDFYKLKFWGLIEEGPKSSHWKILPLGTAFVNNQVSVPRKASIYNNMLIEPSTSTTTIVEALGDHFNYADLMGARLD